MKKILKWSLLIVGSLISLILLIVLTIWFFPNIIVNEKNVRWAVSKQSMIQFEPHFPEKFSIELHNSNVFKQKFKITSSDFCLRMSDQSLYGCFKEFSFATVLDFSKFSLGFESIGPLVVDSSSLKVDTTKFSKSEPTTKNKKRPTLPTFSNDFEIGEIRINLPSIEVISEKSKMNVALDVQGKRGETNKPYDFSVHTKVDLDKDPKSITADLIAKIQPNLDIVGTLTSHVGSSGKKPAIDLNSQIKGNIIKQRGEITGKIIALRIAPIVPVIEVSRFKIAKTEKLVVDADFNSELMIGYLNNPRKSALPPPEFKTKFSGNIEAEQSANDPVQFNLNIRPLEQYGMTIFAKLKGSYDTKKSDLGLETFLLALNINDFKKTVQRLKKTQFAIPAPLNEMQGDIHFQIGNEKLEKSDGKTYAIPVVLTTNLESPRQSLKIDTKGITDITPSPFSVKLKLDIALNDIALQLPNFDPVSKIPNIVADKRFVKTAKQIDPNELFKEDEKKVKTEKPSTFTTEIHITTPEKPIRIFYKLFKTPATFRITTNSTEQKSDFLVKFEPFNIAYLKREARLENLNISNDDKSDSILLDGRFSMKKLDYKIFVTMHQENKKTNVELSSEPPLSEDDIISLILFNELSSSLDSSSTGSVENTQAAMTKKAIRFFSFFVLASTPVESVNYDSATQQYSARVKLPGGFTGTVGSDFDQAQEVGLRRRLGGKFAITTDYGTDQFGQTREESMIEWYHRY